MRYIEMGQERGVCGGNDQVKNPFFCCELENVLE